MRIGFDTSPLVRPHPPGIVRLVSSAMLALERTPGITALRFEPAANENLRLWRQFRLPQLVRERELVGLHSFVSAFALVGGGVRVQTIHELPWRHGVRENAGIAHRFWAQFAALRAERILCASEFVARELGRGPLGRRVRVCAWGVDAAHFGRAPTPEAQREGRESLQLESAADSSTVPLLLVLGGARAKKNVAALLRGMHERRRRGAAPVSLAISGEVGREARDDQTLARALGLEHDVRWLGLVDDARLITLLHASRCVAVLSRSEGFGLPVLEAFAAGRVVIVAKNSAQSELAAGLGIEVDPHDPASVAAGIEASLENDGLESKRRAHAASFSWERCAKRIAEIWRELA